MRWGGDRTQTQSCCSTSLLLPLQIPLPSKPHWYLLFGATEEEIKEVCVTTLRLYTRKKVGNPPPQSQDPSSRDLPAFICAFLFAAQL